MKLSEFVILIERKFLRDLIFKVCNIKLKSQIIEKILVQMLDFQPNLSEKQARSQGFCKLSNTIHFN